MAQSPYFYGGGTAPAGMSKPTPKKPAPKSKTVVKSPAGTSAAQQLVNAALAQMLAPIKAQESSLQASQAGQQEALKGFTAEILNYLKGTPAAIQSDYQGAVDTTSDLAKASSEGLLASNPNSLNQADLAAINAPQAQRDALAAQNQNVYGGGAATLFHTGGVIPATAFAEDKANASAFANSLPSIVGLQGQQLFAKLLSSQGEDMQKLADQRAGVLAKGPGLLQDAQKSLTPSAKAPTIKTFGGFVWQWSGKKWDKIAADTPNQKYGSTTLANGQKQTTIDGQPVGKPWGPVKTGSSGGGSSGSSGKPISFSAATDWASSQTNNTGSLWSVRKKGGGWEAFDTGRPPSGGPVVVPGARNESGGKVYAKGTAYDVLNDLSLAKQGTKIREWREIARDSAADAIFRKKTYQESVQDILKVGVPLSIVQSALNKQWRKPGEHKSWEDPGEGRPRQTFQQKNPKKNGRNIAYVTSGNGIVTSRGWSATHITDGLDMNNGSKTAGDIMGKPGTPVGAPEDGRVVRWGSAQGGEAMYFQGVSGKLYWLGHIDSMLPVGSSVRANQTIARISADHARPHVHIDATGRGSSSA